MCNSPPLKGTASSTLWSALLCLNPQLWGWYSPGQAHTSVSYLFRVRVTSVFQSVGFPPPSTCCVRCGAVFARWQGVQSAIVWWFFFWTSLWSGIEILRTCLTLTDNYWEHLSFKPLILAVPDIKGTECLCVDMLANQGIIFVCKSVFDLSVYSVWLLFLQCAPCTWTV